MNDPMARTSTNGVRQAKRAAAVPKAELFATLEALLPFAEVEVDCLVGFVDEFPEDAERARRGQEAVESAKRLIAKKTGYIRRKEQTSRVNQGQADTTGSPEEVR